MPRAGRALLVVTALSCGGVAQLRPLYRVLDGAAALLGRLLGRSYARRALLQGAAASAAAIVAAIEDLAGEAGVGAVDVFLNVHGQERSLTLAEGEVAVAALAAALRATGEPARRLRLLYSTCCHAAHHAAELGGAGFRLCLGARGINATGAFETPVFLALWSRGVPAARAIRIADHPVARLPADAVARLVLRAAGERGRVDSAKVVSGDRGVAIGSGRS